MRHAEFCIRQIFVYYVSYDTNESQIKLWRFGLKQIENVTSQQIGDVLKNTIKHAGLTQDEVGIKAGIPRNSLNRKLNGGTFNFDELVRISQVTGRKLSEIISDAENLAGVA